MPLHDIIWNGQNHARVDDDDDGNTIGHKIK